MQPVLLVMTNVPDAATARIIARSLLERKLAACISTLPAVQSVYRWQGAIEEAQEVMLLIKTTQARYTELETILKAMHPYQVPEIIALPVTDGCSSYLNWIVAETQRDADV